MKKTKEMIIDVANERYLYGFYELLIKQLELPNTTGRNLDGIDDFLEEPWEKDRVVRFINISKTNDDIRNEIKDVIRMFEQVKEFQNRCGNKFTWTVNSKNHNLWSNIKFVCLSYRSVFFTRLLMR